MNDDNIVEFPPMGDTLPGEFPTREQSTFLRDKAVQYSLGAGHDTHGGDVAKMLKNADQIYNYIMTREIPSESTDSESL